MKSSLEAENKFVFVGIYFYFGTGDYSVLFSAVLRRIISSPAKDRLLACFDHHKVKWKHQAACGVARGVGGGHHRAERKKSSRFENFFLPAHYL